ncbi:hypothetical protein ACQKB0_15535 [Mycobacterium tuberculosis]
MVATRCARLRRACDRHGFDGGDPLRAAAPRLAIATGSDGGDPLRAAAPRLAIATGSMVATRCARLRRACDRHGKLFHSKFYVNPDETWRHHRRNN